MQNRDLKQERREQRQRWAGWRVSYKRACHYAMTLDDPDLVRYEVNSAKIARGEMRRLVALRLSTTARSNKSREKQFAPARGSENAGQKTSELREAFRRMEQEQREEYEDYVRRCGGVPISQVKP